MYLIGAPQEATPGDFTFKGTLIFSLTERGDAIVAFTSLRRRLLDGIDNEQSRGLGIDGVTVIVL